MTNETDLIKAAEEALEIAKGNKPAARLHQSGHTYVPKAELEAAQARIAELEGALRKIGNQKPNFDYAEVPAGEKLEVNNMRPGSPYDRGMDKAYKTLTKMARAALQEGKG